MSIDAVKDTGSADALKGVGSGSDADGINQEILQETIKQLNDMLENTTNQVMQQMDAQQQQDIMTAGNNTPDPATAVS